MRKLNKIQAGQKSRLNPLDLDKRLGRSPTLKDGLYILREYLAPYGVRDLLYIYMPRDKSHVRNDIIRVSTFSQKISDLYDEYGGAASDKLGDVLPHLSGPLFFDTRLVIQGDHPYFSYNKCADEIVKDEYYGAWVVPFIDKDIIGHGMLMLFEDNRKGAPKFDIKQTEAFAPLYHKTMKRHGQMASHFGLTHKECDALSHMADGKTAEEMALELGLTTRAIDLRLQLARKKLRARSTTEAVFKAVAYGILPNCPRSRKERGANSA